MSLMEPDKDLLYLELFAGWARLTRLAKALGYAAEAHDLSFDKDAMKHDFNNSMDLTCEAGFLCPGSTSILCFP